MVEEWWVLAEGGRELNAGDLRPALICHSELYGI